MKKIATVVILASLAHLSTACNTVEGVGKDIKSSGKAIERVGQN